MSTLIGAFVLLYLSVFISDLSNRPLYKSSPSSQSPWSFQSWHFCQAWLPPERACWWVFVIMESQFLSNNFMKVNKQLNDKERVAAALENAVLLETVEQCLANAGWHLIIVWSDVLLPLYSYVNAVWLVYIRGNVDVDGCFAQISESRRWFTIESDRWKLNLDSGTKIGHPLNGIFSSFQSSLHRSQHGSWVDSNLEYNTWAWVYLSPYV